MFSVLFREVDVHGFELQFMFPSGWTSVISVVPESVQYFCLWQIIYRTNHITLIFTWHWVQVSMSHGGAEAQMSLCLK